MSVSFQVQQDYGAAAEAVLNCDLPRYLAVLLWMARIHDISVDERNAVAATAFALADDSIRQEAFDYCNTEAPDWSNLLVPLRQPQVAACLFRDACKVSWADGCLDPQEQELLDIIARHLQLPEGQYKALIEAVAQQETARLKTLALLL